MRFLTTLSLISLSKILSQLDYSLLTDLGSKERFYMNLLKVRDGLFTAGVILLALFLVLTILPLVVFQMGWALAGDVLWVFNPTLVILFIGMLSLGMSILVDRRRK